MLSSTQQRVESLLNTIDRLGIVKIKHLLEIHDLKSYRNACRIISTHLKPFINETYFQKEKVITLNKKGRELIASEKDDIKISLQTIHSLLRNEVYMYFNCPSDWRNEYTVETTITGRPAMDILFQGVNLSNKRKVVADAVFSRNGYIHLIEVDNTQDMKVNRKKIDAYREIMPSMTGDKPKLYFFTTTDNRKRKLEEWTKGLWCEVKTFDEIR